MSSQRLADRAGVDRKTIDRLRKGGRVRIQTLGWVQEALGVSFFDSAFSGVEPRVARAECGSYAYENFANYEGEYYGFRYSYDRPGHVVCYHMEIRWSDESRCLGFAEQQINRDAKGRVYTYRFNGDLRIPAGLGVLHFCVIGNGAARLATASLIREVETPYMCGAMLSLNEVAQVGFYPVATPFCLIKCEEPQSDKVLKEHLGVFDSETLWHPQARSSLEEAKQSFITLGH